MSLPSIGGRVQVCGRAQEARQAQPRDSLRFVAGQPSGERGKGVRSHLRSCSTTEHFEEAFRLLNVSTVDAARSGINEHLNLSPEIANEIKQAEAQIKRTMGIGSHISERRLIDELTRMGMNESIVRRALLIMHQRDEVEYKREGHVIVRKA